MGFWGAALALLPHAAHAQTNCEAIQDQQSRNACFARAGVPVIDCTRPRNADEAAFCRTLPARRPAPVASAPAPAPAPEVARAAMIADDTGQWAGTIRVDTLRFDPTGNGSATVCHQSEHGRVVQWMDV